MTSLVETIKLWVDAAVNSPYGLWAASGFMALESMIAPVPSEAVMPPLGMAVHHGTYTWYAALLAATMGSLIGSLISYYMGYFGGKPLVLKVGKYLLVNEHHLDLTTRWFDRWGSLTVFVCRFVPVVRHFISIPAGIARMNLLKFCLFTVVGAGIWNAFLLWIGWKLEDKWEVILTYRRPLDVAVVALLALCVVAWYWLNLRKLKSVGFEVVAKEDQAPMGKASTRQKKLDHGDHFAPKALRDLLTRVQGGHVSVDSALESLKSLPFEQAGDATLDHHRTLRKGFSEVIYCAGKTPAQVADIAARLARHGPRLLGTRASEDHFKAARRRVPQLQYDPSARVLWLDRDPAPKKEGVVVIAAGTSDLPVADEAARTLEVMGHTPVRIKDVGVAGLHRLLHHLPTLHKAHAVVAVAGMEGALPSVVAGLIAAPVIAVPTSVGYGAAFGGLAALLGMLNSCASGLAVVNIDNGFGAGYMAAMINAQRNA